MSSESKPPPIDNNNETTMMNPSNNNNNVVVVDIESQEQPLQDKNENDYLATLQQQRAVSQQTKKESSHHLSPSQLHKVGESVIPPPATTTTTTTTITGLGTKAPKETLQAVYKAGEYKAGLTLDLLMIQSFMAGVYIAMAGQLLVSLEGGVLGASFFPTGLFAVVLTSGELFTGDALVFVAGVLGGRVPVSKMARNWTVSWCMNFAGCILWAAAMSYGSDAVEDKGMKEFAIKLAMKKAHQPWFHIFLKGIGANFMVCLAIWQATCAEEAAGKILGIWFPTASFVIMGFEHCVANQFFIPLGMMFGADISVVRLLFQALLPATLGNLVGGGIFIGAVYWYVFDSLTSNMLVLSKIRTGMTGISLHGKRNRSHHGNDHGSDAGDHTHLEHTASGELKHE